MTNADKGAAVAAAHPFIRFLGLKSIATLAALAYYRWAMSQIDPLHPDVPIIVCRINDLERQW